MTSYIFIDENNPSKGYQVHVKGCLSEDTLTWLDLTGSYAPQADETLFVGCHDRPGGALRPPQPAARSGINPDFCEESACLKFVMPALYAKICFYHGDFNDYC